jgi:hypothetical protein
LEEENFERFSVYGFSLDYPKVCRIEFNPKSRREGGDVVFHFPDREKLYLTWGALEKVQEKFPTVEEQAEQSLKTIRKTGSVRNLERLKQDSIEVNSHRAAFNHIRLDEAAGGLFPSKRTVKHEAYSVHLRCSESTRYFVIYTMLSANAPQDFGELYDYVVQSFRCHKSRD